MKRINLALSGAAACMTLIASSAGAATFVGTYSETYNTSQEGLTIGTQSLQTGSTLDFTLSPGGSISIDLYQLFTPETTVNGDDTVAQAISTLFDFTGPDSASGSVGGMTVGVKDTDSFSFGFPGNHQYGQVTWNGLTTLVFGDGSRLDVSLNDTRFNEGEFYALNHGSFPYSGDAESNGAPITATFTLEKASPISAAPEPGTWAMMLAGVGAIGLAFRSAKRRHGFTFARALSV